jgi:hypothetical protein
MNYRHSGDNKLGETMSENIDDILGLAAAEAPALPKEEQISELSALVKDLMAVRNQIDALDEARKELTKRELRLGGELIPSKMQELGVSSLTVNERKVTCKPFYSAKIRPESEPLAFDWLEEAGHGDVIKGELIVPYRRPDRDTAMAIKQYIKEQYEIDANVKLGVHHSTLRALARELIEDEGVIPPADLFEMFIGQQTVIK